MCEFWIGGPYQDYEKKKYFSNLSALYSTLHTLAMALCTPLNALSVVQNSLVWMLLKLTA